MARPAGMAPIMTVEEFLVCDIDEKKAELVRGELRVTPPASAGHGMVVANLLRLLLPYVSTYGLGRVFGDGFGYQLVELPHTVRVPDASFVRADRLPPNGLGRGLFKGAPDLAVEVLSPTETASDLDEKLEDYGAVHTSLVWIVDPERRTVMIIAANEPATWLREGDTLTGGEVIEGFSTPVADLFSDVARDL